MQSISWLTVTSCWLIDAGLTLQTATSSDPNCLTKRKRGLLMNVPSTPLSVWSSLQRLRKTFNAKNKCLILILQLVNILSQIIYLSWLFVGDELNMSFDIIKCFTVTSGQPMLWFYFRSLQSGDTMAGHVAAKRMTRTHKRFSDNLSSSIREVWCFTITFRGDQQLSANRNMVTAKHTWQT